jgi:PAS domain S-box-containing protein
MIVCRDVGRLLGVALACCWHFGPVVSTSAATPKRVLIVHSFVNAAPPFTTHSHAFEKELTEKMGEPVDLDEVSLDVARYATLDMEEALVDLMRKRQVKWQPDLVVPIGSPAGVFVARYRSRLFPDTTPIIYAGMDKRRLPAGSLDRHATFVGESFDVRGMVEDILTIAPDTENIAVVIGASPLEQYWADVFRKEFQPFENRLRFTWLNDLSLDAILQRTKTLPPRSFIFLVLMMRDASGVTHNADEVLREIHAVANAPINSIFQHQLGLGIVGGRLYQAEAEGEEAARMAVRILRGEPVSSFPPLIIGATPPRYDWRELKKWDFSESTLPQGSTVLFRAPTFWQQHRGLIIGTASVCVAQGVLITALIVNLLRRRRAERSLGKSEQRVTLAAEAARVGVWELNTKTGEFWASEKARQLFEIDAGSPVDRAMLRSRVHPEDREAREAAIDRAIHETGEYELEYRLLLKDGTIRWISGRGCCMADEEGKPPRLIGISMDVTERKEAQEHFRAAEEEARRQREQIEALGRASLLGEMTASLAHELGQPLAAILANSSAGVRFIDGGDTDPANLREILAAVGTDGRRARDIIHNVRSAIKKGSAVRGRVDINRVVENVLLMLRPDAAAHSCEVQTSLAEGLPRIATDPVQMQQVLINLVSNAFHAMRDAPESSRRVEISTELGGREWVRVSVRDHGTGISKGMEERLFEQFFTTKDDGLGMGLPIVRSIIEAHGGKITAVNADGGGACFRFELPVSAETAFSNARARV